jgi:ubiquinone/menaquinone biosynthesis C-methylase UbiE
MSSQYKVPNNSTGDATYNRIITALQQMEKPLNALTVNDLAPVDHFHARGLPATVELAEHLPIKADHSVLDIGCGLGGPARYLAQRFGCRVEGIDLDQSYVDTANRLTVLLGMEDQITIKYGDASHLPYPDEIFDGAYAQHATMNISDREEFSAEIYRVLKPGGFFALTEHGLGPKGKPWYPTPWSEDGSDAYLMNPENTQALFEQTGFVNIAVEQTRPKYIAFYKQVLKRAAQGNLPPLGPQILMGNSTLEKLRNAARNIEENRT